MCVFPCSKGAVHRGTLLCWTTEGPSPSPTEILLYILQRIQRHITGTANLRWTNLFAPSQGCWLQHRSTIVLLAYKTSQQLRSLGTSPSIRSARIHDLHCLCYLHHLHGVFVSVQSIAAPDSNGVTRHHCRKEVHTCHHPSHCLHLASCHCPLVQSRTLGMVVLAHFCFQHGQGCCLRAALLASSLDLVHIFVRNLQ